MLLATRSVLTCSGRGNGIPSCKLSQSLSDPCSPSFSIIALGGSIALTGYFLSSFATSVLSFILLYGSMGGIGGGINYIIPLVCAWEYFPHRKGLCTGILVGAYGLGSFIYTRVSTRIMNPNDEKATIPITTDLSFFTSDVADNVPKMLRILVAVWLVQITLGVIFISRPMDFLDEKEEEDEKKLVAICQKDNINSSKQTLISSEPSTPKIDPVTGEILWKYELKSVKACFYSIRFYQYFWMMYLANVFMSLFSYLFKPIGLANNIDDNLLSWAGSLAGITQFITRLIVGSLYDYLGFRKIFFALMVMNIFLSFFSYNFKTNDAVWFMCIQMNYIVVAGIFALFPTPTYNTFGEDKAPQIYSIILLGSFFSSLTDNILIKFVYDYVGAEHLFFIGGAASVVAWLILYFFNERLDIERLDKKGLIIWKEPI